MIGLAKAAGADKTLVPDVSTGSGVTDIKLPDLSNWFWALTKATPVIRQLEVVTVVTLFQRDMRAVVECFLPSSPFQGMCYQV